MRLDPAHFFHAVGNQVPAWPFALNRASPKASGLTADWPLFAGPGAGLRDLGEGGYDLSLAAGADAPGWLATGFGGWALDFDGLGDYAVIGTAFDPGPLPLTFSCLVNPASGHTSAVRAMFSKRTGITPSTGRFDIGLYHTTGYVYTYDGNNLRRSTYAPPAGQWTHIAVTIDSGGTATVYANGVSQGGFDGTVTLGTNTTAEARIGRTNDSFDDPFLGQIQGMRFHNRVLSAGEIFALYDPAVRWGLYRESSVPRVWPKAAGGATTRSVIGSLQGVLRRQVSVLASTDAALRAEAVLSALAGAALRASMSRGASLDLAIQILGQAQADLDTALTRALGLDAGLDANLTVEGSSQRAASLDAAIRRLNLMSGALQAALRAPKLDAAVLDAWLALSLEGAAGLDAVAQRAGQPASTALQGVLRAASGRAATLDAIIGLVVAAAVSRTQQVGARGGHAVAGGRRQSTIPSGNRRH